MAKYAKAGVAIAAAALVALQAALTDDAIITQEWLGVGLAVLAAVGVWAVPNKPSGPGPDRMP